MSCLETAKVLFFPVEFLNLNFLTTSVLSLIRKSHLFALDSQPVVDSYISPSFVGSELCSFEPVSQEFVRKFICDSAPNSCVLDPIPTTLLEKYLDDLVPLICKIVNDGSVPRKIKEAVVIPLLTKP